MEYRIGGLPIRVGTAGAEHADGHQDTPVGHHLVPEIQFRRSGMRGDDHVGLLQQRAPLREPFGRIERQRDHLLAGIRDGTDDRFPGIGGRAFAACGLDPNHTRAQVGVRSAQCLFSAVQQIQHDMPVKRLTGPLSVGPRRHRRHP